MSPHLLDRVCTLCYKRTASCTSSHRVQADAHRDLIADPGPIAEIGVDWRILRIVNGTIRGRLGHRVVYLARHRTTHPEEPLAEFRQVAEYRVA